MFRIILFTVFLFSLSILNAQTTPVEIILSSDALNSVEYEVALKISNSANVTISGEFDSDIFVLIKPTSNFNIRIIPESQQSSPSLNSSGLIDPPSTTIRSGPKGNGGIPPSKSIIIYPNPVQNELTFTTTNKFVNEYNIFNSMGFLQISQIITPTNTATINVASLTAGNYILKLNLGNGQQLSIQFIKN